MAYQLGLGKNSTIPISSDPQKFEGLIVRHGQWVRWTVARKCTCLTANNRPDARCPKCLGIGYVYSFQEAEADLSVAGIAVDADTVEFRDSLDSVNLVALRTASGEKLAVAGVFGKWVKVSGVFLQKGATLYASVKKNRSVELTATAKYVGKGVVKISGTWFENEWTAIPYDLISVSSVRRGDGTPLSVLSWSVDKIIIDVTMTAPDEGEILHVEAKYMPPYKIAILSQNLSETDRNFLRDVGGDALAVFPFAYKIGEFDLITLWSGTQVRKRLLKKSAGDLDHLYDNFVSGVSALFDPNKTYVEGVDFVVWDRNVIRWICAEADRPLAGTNLSVEYAANVTYRVMTQLPNIRSSENKRFPSRVALKLEAGITGSDKV